MHPSQGGGRGGGGGGGRGRGRGGIGRDRELIGQTIKITQGPYKSHIGIVKDATETTARVELHSKCQTISVDRSRIGLIGGPSKSSNSNFIKNVRYSNKCHHAGPPIPGHGANTPRFKITSKSRATKKRGAEMGPTERESKVLKYEGGKVLFGSTQVELEGEAVEDNPMKKYSVFMKRHKGDPR